MAIKRERWDKLLQEMEQLGISENDIHEKFILGSGSGGQKINKTASCVYLKHEPTHTEIKCQRARSRELNRYYARKELCERIREIEQKEKSRKQKEIEKIRRQKKRRTRKQKEKMLAEKKKRSEIKKLRQEPKDSHFEK
jgi:peptide chain release factor